MVSFGSYGVTTVLSSSGWQKYYATTNNTVWNPIPLNNDLFGWYSIPGTFNAWPSTPQAVVIYALDLTQYIGIAVLSNLGVPNSFPVNIPNTVTKITLGGRGSYAGILNDGSLSTTDGDDQLAGISYGVGSVNYLGGSGGTGILNKQSAIINTRGGKDRIAGLATGSGGSGILNYGQIFTENGDDKVLSQASGNGTMFGLENRNGLIDTGSGVDLIQGNGTNAIGGIANIQGSILSGDGNDVILGQATRDSGGLSVGIGNNGLINAGSGDDTISGIVNAAISGTATGLNIVGISNNGVINAGSGNDTISGTANDTIPGTATGYSVGIANSKDGSIDGGIGSVNDVDTITGTATGGLDFSRGIDNYGKMLTANGGDNSGSVNLTGNAQGNHSVGIQNYGTINVNVGGGANFGSVNLTGNAQGNYSVGIFNSSPFGTSGTIATGNDADVINGNAKGDNSIGISNWSTITNMGDKMGQIIGTASSGINITGLNNQGLIYMSDTASSDGVVIKGTTGGGDGSYGIENGGNIHTGSGNDEITGETTVGGFGILNFGRIDTGAGNDTVASIVSTNNGKSIGYFGGISPSTSDGVFLGTGNDTLSGFGNGGYFDGGADIDNLILPALTTGQFYAITKGIGNSATIRRSPELGWYDGMSINNFETFTASGSINFTSSPNNFANSPSSFSIFY